MDLATIIGIVVSVGLVAASILAGGSPIMFVNVPSALVVVGGTIGATLMRNPLAAVLGTAKVTTKAFTTKVPSPDELIKQIMELAQTARRNDILSLESAEISYEFLAKGIRMCVDGMELEQIRMILETEMGSTAARHKRGKEILDGMGGAAPAFGMIGTLIGLVQMLAAMDDPSSIGPAMAVALLTTLYGALIANVVCLPLADKLKVRSEEELLSMTLCLEGCLAIARGINPRSIDQQLKSFLAPAQREDKQEEAA